MKKLFKKGTALLLVATMLVTAMVTGVSAEGIYITVDETNKYIFANGYDLTLEEAEDGTAIYVDGSIVNTTIGEDTDGTNGYDLSEYTIFGGSQDTILDTSVSITVNGGEVKAIYAGGTAVFNDDVQAKIDSIETIIDTTLADLTSQLEGLDATQSALLSTVIAGLEDLADEFETDLTEVTDDAEAMLALAEQLLADVEALISDYIIPTTEAYVGDVAAIALENFEEALDQIVTDLETNVETALTNIVTDSLTDALFIIFGVDDMTTEDLEDLISISDIISQLTADQAELEEVQEAIDNYASAPVQSDYTNTNIPKEPVAPTEPTQTYLDAYAVAADSLAADTATLKSIMEASYGTGFLSNSLESDNIDYDALSSLISSISSADDYYDTLEDLTDVYSQGDLSYIAYLADVTTLSTSILPALVTEYNNRVDTDSVYTDDEAYDEAMEQYNLDYTEYKKLKKAYDQAVLDNAEELADYQAAYDAWEDGLDDLEDQEDALNSSITSAYTDLINYAELITEIFGVSLSTNDIIYIISGDYSSLENIITQMESTLTWIEFATELADPITDLVANISTDPTTAIADFITAVEAIEVSEEIEEQLDAIIDAIIENVEEELEVLAQETLTSIETNITTALEDTITDIENEIGTPEELLTTIIEYAIDELDLEATETELQEILDSLMDTLTDNTAKEEIIDNIYETVVEYLNTTDATIEGLIETIINAITDELIVTALELMEIEMTYIEYAEITVNGGYVGDIYAYGADAGYYVAEVIITYYEGTVGNIDDTEFAFDGSTIDLSSLGFGDYITSYLESVLSDYYYTLNSVTVTMLTVDDTEVEPDDTTTPDVDEEDTTTPDVDEEDTTTPDVDEEDTTTPDVDEEDTTTPDVDEEDTTTDEDADEDDEDDDTVQTGDNSSPQTFVVLMFISMLGIFVISRKKLVK